MASERDEVAHGNPWPWIGWAGTLVIVFAAGMLGFFVLSRYQQNGPVLGIWTAMCRSIGLTFDGAPAAEAKAPAGRALLTSSGRPRRSNGPMVAIRSEASALQSNARRATACRGSATQA